MNNTDALILIVDDDEIFCRMVEDMVDYMGYRSLVAHTIEESRRALKSGRYDLVLLDLSLPDGNALTLLPWIRTLSDPPEIIIITGDGDAQGAKLAVANGAWDYLMKTTPFERINLIISRAIEHRRTRAELMALKGLERHGIIGNSPAMIKCLEKVSQAAMNDFNVLITGESGTGKELFAKSIHMNSKRSVSGRMVVVDCAAIPKTLAESTLFGHVKGSFTGADKNFTGLFQEADGGTLFLDEIGELPADLQKIFLRVLQERRYRPIGSNREEKSNFRLIAATNRDLDQLASQGIFRRDLLFRLRSISINLPPLRERSEDITELALYFLALASESLISDDKSTRNLSVEFEEALLLYDWPGNVRELQHVMEAAYAASMNENKIIFQHLPQELRAEITARKVEPDSGNSPRKSSQKSVSPDNFSSPINNKPINDGNDIEPLTSIREYRQRQDEIYLTHLMQSVDGDMHLAAETAGLSLSRLYSLLREHGITISR